MLKILKGYVNLTMNDLDVNVIALLAISETAKNVLETITF